MMTIHNCLNQEGIDLKLKLLKCDETMKFLSELAKELNDEEKIQLEKTEKILLKYLDKYYSEQVQRVRDLGFETQ